MNGRAVMQVSEHIHALKIPFKINISPGKTADRFVYAYFICGEKIALIDTGVSGSGKAIFDYLKSIGKKPRDISAVLLTHSHPDHIGSARSIKEASGCEIYINAAERAWAEDIELQYRERPIPGFHSLVEGPVGIDHVVRDGDIIRPDKELALEAFHVPGHSSGSTAFFLKNDKALFSGDAILLPGQMPVFDDIYGYADSLKKLKNVAGIELLLSSWDVPRKGREVHELIDKSISYLEEIRNAVEAVAAAGTISDTAVFCEKVVDRLKLPCGMANPMVARSFLSVLKKGKSHG